MCTELLSVSLTLAFFLALKRWTLVTRPLLPFFGRLLKNEHIMHVCLHVFSCLSWRSPLAYLCYYAVSLLLLFCVSFVVILLFAMQGLAFCRAPAFVLL